MTNDECPRLTYSAIADNPEGGLAGKGRLVGAVGVVGAVGGASRTGREWERWELGEGWELWGVWEWWTLSKSLDFDKVW